MWHSSSSSNESSNWTTLLKVCRRFSISVSFWMAAHVCFLVSLFLVYTGEEAEVRIQYPVRVSLPCRARSRIHVQHVIQANWGDKQLIGASNTLGIVLIATGVPLHAAVHQMVRWASSTYLVPLQILQWFLTSVNASPDRPSQKQKIQCIAHACRAYRRCRCANQALGLQFPSHLLTMVIWCMTL